jgi:hypothetical protein
MMHKASHILTGAVFIDYNGSGGDIVLNRVANSCDHQRFEPDPNQYHSFVAEDGGRRLALVRPTPGTWLSLPKDVLHYIVWKLVEHPGELQIDLDVDSKLSLSLPHVNKELYRTRWRDLLENTEYTLRLRSTDKRSRFSNFRKLARLLRHQFTLPIDPGFPADLAWTERSVPRETWMLEDLSKLNIVLDFNLAEPTALEDLRISVIHLLLETSSTPGVSKVTIRSFAAGLGGQSLVAERAITLQKLRMNIVMTMMVDVLEYDHPIETSIWINGLGDVVEKEIIPIRAGPRDFDYEIDTASTISWHNGWYQVASMHPKDRRYRGEVHSCICKFEDCTQFSQFNHSASQVLRYLTWVLDVYSPTSYIRREVYVCELSHEQRYPLTSRRVFGKSLLRCACYEDECHLAQMMSGL